MSHCLLLPTNCRARLCWLAPNMAAAQLSDLPMFVSCHQFWLVWTRGSLRAQLATPADCTTSSGNLWLSQVFKPFSSCQELQRELVCETLNDNIMAEFNIQSVTDELNIMLQISLKKQHHYGCIALYCGNIITTHLPSHILTLTIGPLIRLS